MRAIRSAAGLFVAASLFAAAACSSREESQAGRGRVTVFEGARLIMGDGSAPIEDSAFIVSESQFSWVGPRRELQVLTGAGRVDLTGKTVMPAIVDVHGHLGFLDMAKGTMSKANFTREQYIDHLQRYAYHGVAAAETLGRFEDGGGHPAHDHLATAPTLDVALHMTGATHQALDGIRGGEGVTEASRHGQREEW